MLGSVLSLWFDNVASLPWSNIGYHGALGFRQDLPCCHHQMAETCTVIIEETIARVIEIEEAKSKCEELDALLQIIDLDSNKEFIEMDGTLRTNIGASKRNDKSTI